jgi:hypothetical protein
MNRYIPLFWGVFSSLIFVATLGCGSKYVPVKGSLLFADGTPATGLEGRQIIFQKIPAGEETSSQVQSTGTIDAQGKFTMGTDQIADGVPSGTHRIMISEAVATGDIPPPAVIDKKYSNFETSGLQYEVKAGAAPPEFKLDRAK